jgi:predicted thioesterase
MALEPGLIRETNIVVQQSDTAAAIAGSNLPSVLSTPRLISLMETTAHQALTPFLSDGQSSVGAAVNIKHMAATPVGMRVRFRLELVAVDGRKLTFKVEAWDAIEKIAEGDHERYIIELDRFASRVEKKQQEVKT